MPASRADGKSASAFRTISEVSVELDVPQHVLRFWEGKFSQVRPLKRGGGRRYYRPEDISLLRRIRDLLYDDGYTIKGVQRLLREGRGKDGGTETAPAAEADPSPASGPVSVAKPGAKAASELQSIIDELSELRDLLGAAAKGKD